MAVRDRGEGGIRPEAVLAILLILSILMIIFSGVMRERTGREWGTRALLSVQRSLGRATESVKEGFGSLRRLREMRVQYESALERLGEYQGLERNYLDLQRENDELKRQLGYSSGMELNNVPARIVAGDPSNLFSTLTIDAGRGQGVEVGMAVTAFQDGFFGLVGKVVSVDGRSSQVRPLIDPDHYVAARLHSQRYDGLVGGRGGSGGELLMRYVQKRAGADIGVHDLVVTSGMQSLYPPGIYIGRVEEVRSKEYDTSLELVLRPIIDIRRTEYVFVVKETRP